MTDITQELREQAEAKAMIDYQAALGKAVEVKMISAYNEHDDSVDVDGIAIQVIVQPTNGDELRHWVDEYLDPYWNVTPVDADMPELKGLRSFWTFGPSYRVVDGKVQSVDNNQAVTHKN